MSTITTLDQAAPNPATVTPGELAKRLNRIIAGRCFFCYRNDREEIWDEVALIECNGSGSEARIAIGDGDGGILQTLLVSKAGELMLDSAISDVSDWANNLKALLHALKRLQSQVQAEGGVQ